MECDGSYPCPAGKYCSSGVCVDCPGLQWSVGDAINDPVISSPTANAKFGKLTYVSCTSNAPSDTDHYTAQPPCPSSGDEADTVTATWSASGGGSWLNGINTGTSVTYITPNSAGNVTLTVTFDDAGTPSGRNDSPKSANVTIEVVEVQVQKVQYQEPGNGYKDISGTLYVHLGTTVTFKAIPNPSGASWPSGKPVWGGTAGASGTGEVKSITFNSISTSTTDYKTVTCECGNTITVNVIVYSLTTYVEPVAFTGRSNSRFGLKETVTLFYLTSPSPPGSSRISASSIGGLHWSNNGVGSINDNPTSDDGLAEYDAGMTVGTVSIKLEILSGPNKGWNQTFEKNVVRPESTYLIRYGTNCAHTYLCWSVGFRATIYILPSDVSFTKIVFSEGYTLSVADGWCYDKGMEGREHPQGAIRFIVDPDINYGCQVGDLDAIHTGNYGPPPEFSNGWFLWVIPHQYGEYVEFPTWHCFTSVWHIATSDELGGAHLSKGGAESVTKYPSDETSYAD